MVNLRTSVTLLIALCAALRAQAPQTPAAPALPSFMGPCPNISCEMQNDWSRNNALIYSLAGAMPEDKFTFKPTPAQQSFGERVLHVAEINLMLLQTLGAKTPAPAVDLKTATKTESMAALQKVGAYGLAVIKEFSEPQLAARVDAPPVMAFFMGPMLSRQRVLYFLMTHSQDTYGQLVVYLRLNGITPPASRQY